MAQASGIENLTHLTECPICLDRLLPPVDTCVKGHAVCQKCRKEVSRCPTCRDAFSTNQNVLLNQMLESVPLACKYNSSGCIQRMILKTLFGHENKCNFRDEKCCFCEKLLRFRSFFDHLSDHLSGHNPIENNIQKVNCFQTFRISFRTLGKKTFSVLIYIKEMQTFLILRGSREEGNKFTFTFQYTEDNNKISYFYEMRIDQKLPFNSQRAIFTYFGLCSPYLYCESDWKNHKRAITLDLNQIFLTENLPESFIATFQIKQG